MSNLLDTSMIRSEDRGLEQLTKNSCECHLDKAKRCKLSKRDVVVGARQGLYLYILERERNLIYC